MTSFKKALTNLPKNIFCLPSPKAEGKTNPHKVMGRGFDGRVGEGPESTRPTATSGLKTHHIVILGETVLVVCTE